MSETPAPRNPAQSATTKKERRSALFQLSASDEYAEHNPDQHAEPAESEPQVRAR